VSAGERKSLTHGKCSHAKEGKKGSGTKNKGKLRSAKGQEKGRNDSEYAVTPASGAMEIAAGGRTIEV